MCVFLQCLQMCSQWKEIAFIMRDSKFKESEEHLIDIFDIKVCPPILFFLSFIIFFSIIEGILKGQLYIYVYTLTVS